MERLKLFGKQGFVITAALIPVIIMAVVFFGTVSRKEQSNTPPPAACDLTEGWYGEDGSEIDSQHLPKGRVVMSHSLEDMDTKGMDICFKAKNTNIRVLFDGELVYEYIYSPVSPIFGKSYGTRVVIVPIHNSSSQVTLELEPLYENVAASVLLIKADSSAVYLNDLYQRELPGFSMCVMIFVSGLLMMFIGVLTTRHSLNTDIDFYSLGAFAMLIGVYSSNETFILQLITERPELVMYCAAVALMFISYFPVSFVASITHQRKSVFLPVLFALNYINFIVTTVLTIMGISDVQLMLTFSHVNIALALFMTFYLMWKALRRKKDKKDTLNMMVAGMSAAMTGAGIDLARYLLITDRKLSNSFFTRTGVLIFVTIMGIYLIRENTRTAVEKERSALMEKLAYTDGLTGLSNRRAFHRKENEIRTGSIECTIVQLDINDLKKVNDVYGHAEGDRHIRGAAEIISTSFEDTGICYRTGGDEFVVIAPGCTEEKVGKVLEKMEKTIAGYNTKNSPPVPLQIAYGSAVFTAKNDMLEAAEQLADERMYQKKKQMKAQMAL